MSKEKSIIQIPSLILTSQNIEDANNPFLDFQVDVEEPTQQEREGRHYFESCVITPGVNRNLFEVTPEAMEMVAVGYSGGCPLSINHDKGGGIFSESNTLGYGKTVAAKVIDGKLYVVSYLALNKTYPNGPFGNAEELRDGIVDGFVGNVSQSLRPLEASCSVCQKPYPLSYDQYESPGYCQHYRGEQVILKDDEGNKTLETVHIVVEKAEAVELSLVMIPADEGSGITKPIINFSLNDFIDETRMKFLAGGDPGPNIEPKPNTGDPKGGNPVSTITQEQFNAMQQRASTAEAQVATLNASATQHAAEIARLEGEVNTAKAEVKTAEAQKSELQAKLDAAEAKVSNLEAAAEIAKKDLEAKETRITKLETEANDNKIVIEDGKAARESIIERFADAYAAAVGDECTEAMKEEQREVAKSLSIEILEKKIAGFKATAKVNYPSGKQVGGKGEEGEEGEDGPALVGV